MALLPVLVLGRRRGQYAYLTCDHHGAVTTPRSKDAVADISKDPGSEAIFTIYHGAKRKCVMAKLLRRCKAHGPRESTHIIPNSVDLEVRGR